MSDLVPKDHAEAIALFRSEIVGSLTRRELDRGDLSQALLELSQQRFRPPRAKSTKTYSVTTLERWYYAARRAGDPLVALSDRRRMRAGRFPSLSAQAEAALLAQYREHPGWTVQLHYDNLKVVLAGHALPSYPTVRRFFRARGMQRRRAPRRGSDGAVAARDRLEQREVRSFEMEHIGALWHLDYHHGSRRVLTRDGQWLQPFLMCIMDDRSRLVCHAQWYLDESACSLVHALTQAILKRGLPRALMSDNGAAMLAGETTNGLARLGVVHQTTLPYSPYQNAKQESFWARVESRLMAMLEGEAQLSEGQRVLHHGRGVELHQLEAGAVRRGE